MRITFLASYRDFAEISYFSQQQKSSTGSYVKSCVIYSALLALIASIPAVVMQLSIWSIIFTFSVVSVLSFIIFWQTIPRKDRFLSHYHSLLDGREDIETLVDIDDAGVRVRNLNFEFFSAWDTIQKIEETEDRFILVTKLLVTGIPKRAFEKTEDIGSFIAFTKSRLLYSESQN